MSRKNSPKKELRKLNVGFIGGGERGAVLQSLLLNMPDVEIVAVCELYEDRLREMVERCVKKGRPAPSSHENHIDLLDNAEDLDCVIVPTAWESHVPIAVAAMERGIPVGFEVGGACSLDDCWQLVRVQEASGTPCMMLENCCYGRNEMAMLKLVKEGLFGELVHCEGGYHHDLRKEICCGEENRHYRLRHFKTRNGELYPTHELGPIAKWLGIHRGNRMVSLTATASKARGLNAWARENKGAGHPLAAFPFNEGDIVTTVIKCANGETIVLTHDCSLHRPYSRGNVIQGTRGIYMEERNAVSIQGITKRQEGWDPETWEPLDKHWDTFEHPLWKKYQGVGVQGGHDGMDYLVMRAFLEAVREGRPTPIDVYDAAAWMAITPLSEASIARGSAPVEIPDFTNGLWVQERPVEKGTYCLDAICEPGDL